MNLGPLERKRRVWFPGNDHSDELSEVNELLSDLTDQLGTGTFKRGTPQRVRLDERIQSLTKRQEVLAALPQEPAGWRYEATGELFSDWWESQDTEARNIWLRQMNFRVVWKSHAEGVSTVVDEFKLDGDLTMDLDADQLFGPIVDVVAELSNLK